MPVGNGQDSLSAAWQTQALRRGLLARLLWPASRLYGALSALRRWLFSQGWLRTHRLSVPVIVVGNVVVGGAGKTPTTIALVQHLQARGWRPGVVSRGYGRPHTGLVHVHPGTPTGHSGDEPALVQHRTGVPVVVASQRAAAARALLSTHPEVDILLCDDGLQHLALARDIAVVVFDDRALGNGWLLPAGLLREPWPPGHRAGTGPASLVLCQSRQGERPPPVPLPPGVPSFAATRRLADHALDATGHRIALRQLLGRPLHAVAGIARPAVFFSMLTERGLTLAQETHLPDHASDAAYQRLLDPAGATVICTEKDAVKLFEMARATPGAHPEIWTVPLELHPQAGFFSTIDALLADLHRSPRATPPGEAA